MKTRLLCTLLLLFAVTLPLATADEWVSEEYRCALTLPTRESWNRELRQQIPNGEVVFHASFMDSKQGIMITYLPNMPSSDIRNPAVQKRIKELLETQGWTIEGEPKKIERGRQPFLQYITQRQDVAGKLIGIARVTPRPGKSLYVITAYGKGGADRAEDPDFMRVMETFRFIDQPLPIADHPTGPPAKIYRIAMFGTAGAIALLLFAFAGTWFRVRYGAQYRA